MNLFRKQSHVLTLPKGLSLSPLGVFVLCVSILAAGEVWAQGLWTKGKGKNKPGRNHHAMVYDSVRDVMILHGGSHGTNIFPETME